MLDGFGGPDRPIPEVEDRRREGRIGPLDEAQLRRIDPQRAGDLLPGLHAEAQHVMRLIAPRERYRVATARICQERLAAVLEYPTAVGPPLDRVEQLVDVDELRIDRHIPSMRRITDRRPPSPAMLPRR